ncbi:hypothetical protein B0T21DRAFT_291424 [Apiosordaria backusii]|uniref:Uncharacterized protein n=1 Tax=Apiosordaria backusii TaxID=314023 RepID=A0AA40EEX9_9PEZI|nr:hypothetical protein B0T21DRAFT_291424 [Apiosordaria backusii]
MALPITASMMPRACLAAARPLRRIFIETAAGAWLPPLHRHRAHARFAHYRIARIRQADTLLFTDHDIPPFEAWEQIRESDLTRTPKGITMERMHEVANIYGSIATRNASAWQGRLQTAIMLWMLTDLKLPLHMLSTASALSYHPSTVSVMKLLAQMKNYSEARVKLREIGAHFRLLARTTRDPDILTVQGLMALREDQEDAALRFFQQAITADELKTGIMPPLLLDDWHAGQGETFPGRPLRFSYERSCYYKLGKLLLKRGQRDEAREALQVAGQQLRYAPALVEYARMLPLGVDAKNNELRHTFILSATENGNQEALRQMVVDLLMKYEDPEKYSPKAFKEDPVDVRVIWEWCLLALSGRSETRSLFGDKSQFLRVHNAIWSNSATMSLAKQADDGEVTLDIWVYPTKLPKLGNHKAEPKQFKITI